MTTDPESTLTLLERIRAGDTAAREHLIRRLLPPLERFARGRLPAGARDLVDTDDIVQMTLIRALNHLDDFEAKRPGAFLAYCRQALVNRVRDEARRIGRRPEHREMPAEIAGAVTSPVEKAIGAERLESYEAALATLGEEQRQAFMLRMEMGLSHQEVADAIGCPSAAAARMIVSRVMVKLAELMGEGGSP